MRTKIEALKHAAQELRNGKYYSYLLTTSCNCGIVAQSLMETSDEDHSNNIFRDPSNVIGCWNSMIVDCSVTGTRMHRVLECLYAAGFTQAEISSLERLNDKKILDEAGLAGYIRHNLERKNVIAYLDAWVRIIERETKPETVPFENPSSPMEFVSAEEMIKKQVLILTN